MKKRRSIPRIEDVAEGLKERTRLINSDILTNFQTLLKREMWESVHQNQDTNYMFMANAFNNF